MSLSIQILQQLDACCDRYEAAWRRGESPDREEYARGLPDEARPALLEELAVIEAHYRSLSTRIAAPTQDAEANGDRDAAATAAPPPGSAGLRIRCPHCQGGVEVLADAPLDQITCGTCGSAFGLVDGPDPDDPAPRTVGRFRLLERIGVGGFGAVWRARDPELDRDVAVKIPRRGQLAPHEAELFFREARAAAQLAHPNIVPVHEVGRDDTPGGGRSVYIVSELIDGEPLSDRLKRERLPIRESVRLLAEVADALHYAHERGVIHRDLKPSNVMLDGDGQPHLMDFGLAKREVGEITMTVDGQVLGTPAYMSPEQAGGQVRWVDRRTDLYALGVMLFQMLTGELPFRGTAQSQIQQRLTDDPPSPRRLDAKAPLDLVTVCLKCMERDPNRRYPNAADVASELRRYLAGEPVHARPLSRVERAVRWARRRPASATALVLGAVLAVAGPIAAAVIATQKAQIAARLDEREGYIQKKESEADTLRGERDALRAELTGAGPGDRDASWRGRLAEGWLDRHADGLADDPTPAQQLGLGLLQAMAERHDDALLTLRAAETRLAEMAESEAAWAPLHAACCDRLEALLRAERDHEEAARYARLASASRAGGDPPDAAMALSAALGPEMELFGQVEASESGGPDAYRTARALLSAPPLPEAP